VTLVWMARGLRVVAPRFRSKPLLKFVIRRLPLHNSRSVLILLSISSPLSLCSSALLSSLLSPQPYPSLLLLLLLLSFPLLGYIVSPRFRCGVGMINILGTGPIRRNLKFRRLVESFFHISSEVFLSLDGKALHIYEDYSFPAPMFSIPLLSVATLVVGYCDRPVERSEDRIMIILNTFEKDIIQIQYDSLPFLFPPFTCFCLTHLIHLCSFAESRVRQIWIRTLMQALHSPSLSFIN
jgi:hypothetical protein